MMHVCVCMCMCVVGVKPFVVGRKFLVCVPPLYTSVQCMYTQAVGKLRLCKEMSIVPEVDLNASQSASLLRKLTDKYVALSYISMVFYCEMCLFTTVQRKSR